MRSLRLPGLSRMLGGGGNNVYQPSLLNGLVAYWKLDEASDGSAPVARVDSVGGLILADTGNVPSVAGKLTNGLGIAAGKYLTINNTATLNPVGDFTISAWVRRLSGATTSLIFASKGTGTAATAQYFIGYSSSVTRLRLAVSNGTTLYVVNADALGAPALNTWYHLVAWYVSATGKISIQINNGTIDEADSFTGGVPATAQAFAVGALAGGTSIIAHQSDELALWNRVLLDAERTTLYNGGSGSTHPFDGSTPTPDYLSGSFIYSSSIEA